MWKLLPAGTLSAILFASFFLGAVFAPQKAIAQASALVSPPQITAIDGVNITETIPQTANSMPTFSGICGIEDALIDIEIFTESATAGLVYETSTDMDTDDGDSILTGNTTADGYGNWEWTVTKALKVGIYRIVVTATDTDDSTTTSSASLKFEIIEPTKTESTSSIDKTPETTLQAEPESQSQGSIVLWVIGVILALIIIGFIIYKLSQRKEEPTS